MTTTPTAATEQQIYCTALNPSNRHGESKSVATITTEGMRAWCLYCRGEHVIERSLIVQTWEQRGVHRVTCSVISTHRKGNPLGHPKLFVKIIPDVLLIWCRFCNCAHRITKEQCMQVWAGGEAVVQHS